MSTSEENVLVVHRDLFDRLGSFQGLNRNPGHYLSTFLHPENNLFLPRSRVEPDPAFKQIIPYAVLLHEGRILHYVRGGSSGEKRLVAKGSIGIGGHVNDTDKPSLDATAYHNAVQREIAEELQIEGGWEERTVALINDDSTEVGSVHLGVVHLVTLESANVSSGESAIAELTFLTPGELLTRLDSLETWSQIILAAWNDLEKQ